MTASRNQIWATSQLATEAVAGALTNERHEEMRYRAWGIFR